MDSLQVTSSSKSSSRSTSPSRALTSPMSPTLLNFSRQARGREMQTSTPRAPAPRPRDPSAVLFTSPNTGSVRTSHGSKEAVSEDDVQDQVTISGATGSAEALVPDDVDSAATPDLQRARVALERLQDKMGRTRDQIREEQTARDDNVNEYLKLAASADKQQLMRIKAVFEKKNQKSAQAIAGLQRKLESYSRKLRDLEATVARGADNAGHHRQPREVLRDMGQGLKNVGGNIRDGISGLSGTVMSKPREFAHLIKNKFGSADNINSLGKSSFYTGVEESSEEDAPVSGQGRHHGSATLPAQGTRPPPHGSEEGAPSECSSATSESLPPSSGRHNHSHGSGHQTAPPAPTHHVTSPKHNVTAPAVSLEHIFEEIHELRDDLTRLRTDFDALKSNVQAEQQFFSHSLLDERCKVERLEEQLNDLTELHQTEVENLKTQVADSEEKVQYQSEERLRDIHEMLEACQTKISKMEHQQHQHQQYVTLEGIHNSNARALVVKLINVVLTVLQVVLLLVATTAGITMPFLRTRLRVLTTVLLVGGVVFIVRQWPEVRDVGSHLMRHMKQALAVK